MAAAETPAMEEAAKEVVMAVANAEALLVEHSQRGGGWWKAWSRGGVMRGCHACLVTAPLSMSVSRPSVMKRMTESQYVDACVSRADLKYSTAFSRPARKLVEPEARRPSMAD